jgi:uncharacterized damage-inducible protein DinB
VIITGLNLPVNAQEKDTTNQFKIDFIKMFDSSSLKTTELAASIPAEHYDWRPADEVRSIRETLLHLAGTNYFLASVLNSPVPEGINPREFSKSVKTKKAIQEIVAISIEHIRAAIQQIDNDQLFTKVDFFGRKETMQRVILQVGEHMAEHLGQLIVYARIKGVTPPWSK